MSRLLVALAALAVLAIAATSASATSIQTQAGQPYTGVLNGALAGTAVFGSSQGTTTCNQSSPTGQILTAGSSGTLATGSISAIDWTNSGMQACPTTVIVPHSNFAALGLPWSMTAGWLSDNTSGTPNGALTLSNVSINADFPPVACTFTGDFNNTGTTQKQVQGDFFNPDNTSGNTELRFVNEPLELAPLQSGACPATGTFAATYRLTGAGAAKLQIRNPLPPATSPTTSPTPAQGATKAKCKKKKGKKHSASAAKGCKKKKKKR